jgi:hypothetical protein
MTTAVLNSDPASASIMPKTIPGATLASRLSKPRNTAEDNGARLPRLNQISLEESFRETSQTNTLDRSVLRILFNPGESIICIFADLRKLTRRNLNIRIH